MYLCRLIIMNNYIPKYLTSKESVIWTICGTALFAELFILIYQPFGSRSWTDREWIFIGFATLAVLVAMAIITASRTFMYLYAKKHRIAYWEYGVWILVEIFAMSFTYSLFPIIVLHRELNFLDLFREAMIDTFFILLIPYTVATLAFILEDKTKRLKELGNNSPSQEKEEEDNTIVCFKDEKGDVKLSLRAESIYYIESADNYATIYYSNNEKQALSRYMLRNSLKQIEDSLNRRNMVRCHRSYIVNLDKVKVLSRSKEGLQLDFGKEGLRLLPVSKTYSRKVIEIFS